MSDDERGFYVMDFITDVKVLCEKSENLNKELKRKQKQVFNNFLTHARLLLTHLESTMPIDDETFLSMEDVKYNLTLEMKAQYLKKQDE